MIYLGIGIWDFVMVQMHFVNVNFVFRLIFLIGICLYKYCSAIYKFCSTTNKYCKAKKHFVLGSKHFVLGVKHFVLRQKSFVPTQKSSAKPFLYYVLPIKS